MRVLRACALLPVGLAAAQLDTTVLAQSVVKVHNEPVQKPTNSQVQKVRPAVRSSVDHVLNRVTKKMNLPIPAPFLWDAIGKITTWAMDGYQQPKTAAMNDLTDGAIDMVSAVLSGDISKLSDEELAQKLINWGKIQNMAHHFADQKHAPPAVNKLIDTTIDIVKTQKAADADSMAKTVIEVARQVSGDPLADLLIYAQKIVKQEETPDEAKALDMSIPIFKQMGAPPAIEELLKGSVENLKSHAVVDNDREAVRVMSHAAKACAELNLPSSFADLFNLAAELHNQPPSAAQEAKFFDISAALVDQIEGPHSVAELFKYNADARRAGAAMPDFAKINELVQKTITEVGLPSAVGELLTFFQTHDGAKLAEDKEGQNQLNEIQVRLMQQAALPEAVMKAQKDAQDMVAKGEATQEKLFKVELQLLRKLKMNSIADIMNAFGTPMLKGKQPDAFAMLAAAPALMKLSDDMQVASALIDNAANKMLGPMLPIYERMVKKITGNMPESFLKGALVSDLNLLRPPVRASA
eukprot:CAMPEP_0197881560 /NCGR_PEP_ID=MMETSP1439-20131203/8999_1 /TAXON_ID=66791 /ORGANISM="Gonyaulax spinifera, Strain CCMP409" /LENGTH=524 /DNA_ID=CAMNT_0043501181 /DNA_START=100 /DNA_END=1674 /DNA_ORIENTATION=+